MRFLSRVWHPNPLPRKSIPRHSPKLPRPSRTCSGSRGTRSWHPNVVVSQWDLCLEMSLSLAGEVAYATLPPLVTGFHDRPAGRCIVSERIGGTVQRTVGPAERAAMRLLSRVWHPNPLPRKSIPRHSPKLPRPSRTCSGSRVNCVMHPYIGVNQRVRSGNESEPSGEVDYAILSPHVGFHEGPRADAS